MKVNKCLNCNKELIGRFDKKYCDAYCKSAYQYKRNKENEPSFYVAVDKQLKLNRKILKQYNKAGKATVRGVTIIDKGFNPNFFTHFWKNKKGDVYLFNYEYGFLKTKENNNAKFILIKWQDYMSKN